MIKEKKKSIKKIFFLKSKEGIDGIHGVFTAMVQIIIIIIIFAYRHLWRESMNFIKFFNRSVTPNYEKNMTGAQMKS